MALQIKNKRIFYVDSGTQLTNLNNTFQSFLQIEDGVEYDRITVLQMNIPISYYMVQDGSNTFVLTETGVPTTVTITPGNYNINSFSNTVEQLLNQASPGGYTYSCNYPNSFGQNNTGKITYAVNTVTPVSFTFSNKLAELFGFPQGTWDWSVGTGQMTITSEDVVKFVPEDTLFVHSNLVGEYVDVLQEVYNQNSAPLTNLVYLATDPLAYSKKLTKGALTKAAQFSLTDENGLAIYLNGLNMTMTLMVYKDPDYFEKSTAYMKWQVQRELNGMEPEDEVEEQNQAENQAENQNQVEDQAKKVALPGVQVLTGDQLQNQNQGGNQGQTGPILITL